MRTSSSTVLVLMLQHLSFRMAAARAWRTDLVPAVARSGALEVPKGLWHARQAPLL